MFSTFQSMAIFVDVFDRFFCKLVRARLIHRAETHVDGFRVPRVFQGLVRQDVITFRFAGFNIISIVSLFVTSNFMVKQCPLLPQILITDNP